MADDADLALVRGFKAQEPTAATDDADLAAIRTFGKPAPSTATTVTFRTREAPKGFEELFGSAEAARLGKKVEPEGPSRLESRAQGFTQGGSLGFVDEAQAALDTGVSKIPGLRTLAEKSRSFFARHLPASEHLPVDNPDLTYTERRDFLRQKAKGAQAAHPGDYIGGELAGGLLPVLATGGTSAPTLGKAIGSAVFTGAKFGAANALGSSEADLTKGEFGNAAVDTLKGGAAGAALGVPFAIAGHAAGKFVKGASDSIRKFVLKDIVGDEAGASTPTARKNLARDAEDIADLVTKDRPLETVLRKASYQGKRHINEALDMVNNRLETASAPREQLYTGLDQALDKGGVESGDFVDFLKKAIKDRKKSGKGYDAGEARELQKIVDRIEGAEDWGYRPTLEPKSQQIVDNLTKQRLAAIERGENPARYDTAIENIKAEAPPGEPVFDRKTIVPSEKLRDIVTDAQKTAFEGEGSINGTERYNRAREVARVPEQYLDKLLGKAARKVPDIVRGIDEHDTAVSALLRVKNVLQQRALKAENADAGESLFGRVVHAVAHPKREIQTLAVSGAVRAGVAARRASDRAARSLTELDSDFSRMVIDALTKGLPLATAVEAAEAAGRGSSK